MPRKKKGSTRPPKTIPVEEMAAALAYARLHSDAEAAQKFRVSVRTLQRKRAAVEKGTDPELAELVAEKKKEATERCRDLLTDTYEHGLRALAKRFELTGEERMKDRDLVGALHILGNQRIGRDALSDPDEQPVAGDSGGSPA